MSKLSADNLQMNYFLQDVAKFLFELEKGNFIDLVVVFPNRRARLFFNKYLSALSKNPVWAPKYYTISDFVQQISGLQVADPLSLLFGLFKVYKDVSRSNETFDTFYYYGETILSDFDDIDKYFANADKIYQNLSDLEFTGSYFEFLSDEQVKVIKQFWNVYLSSRPSDEKEKFTSLWTFLKEIYRGFNEQLDAKRIAYEGKIYRSAVEKLKNADQSPFDKKRIAFVGFNALNHCEELLFEHFNKSGNASFFWDFDETYTKSDIHEAGFFLKKYLKSFPPPAGFKSQTFLAHQKSKIYSVSVPSNIAQAKVISNCLELIHSKDHDHQTMTALVLADEGLLLPVVNSLPSSVENVNISMGYPVVDTPSYSFISLLADLQLNKRNHYNDQNCSYYHKDFFGIINHVYMERIRKTEEFAEFESQAKEKNLVFIDPADFKNDEPLYNLIYSPINDPADFASHIVKVIKIVAHQLIADGAENKEIQWHLGVLHGILKVLVRFESLIREADINISFQTSVSLLRKILKGISVPFSGEPLTGFQIMGILETRTLDFENLIILSMNEGKFPKTSHSPSLIPYSLRQGFGLPTIQHQDAIFGYNFYRLLHRSGKVVLVHHTKTEGLQKGEQSRYLYQLRYDSNFTVEEISLGYKVAPIPVKKISAGKSAASKEILNKYLSDTGSTFMSPSALNTFLNCKLRFFFKYIEGMKEPEDVDEEIESNVFGSIIHHAIESLYKDFIGRTISKNDIITIRSDHEKVDKAVDTAFAKEYLAKETLKEKELYGKNLIIRKVIYKYIDSLLEYDSNQAPFNIISLEKAYSMDLFSPKTKKHMKIGGYIDRLDEKDGILRIVDYKTGLEKNTFENIEELFDLQPSKRNDAVFQVFLYALILQNSYHGNKFLPALYYIRNICKPDFDFHIIKSENRKINKVTDFGDFAIEFEKRLSLLIDEILDEEGSYEQTEDAKYCQNCPYNVICTRKG